MNDQFYAAMSEEGEELMRELRVRLGQALACEQFAAHMPNGTLQEQEARRAELELADAYGAVAANKGARAYRIGYKALPIAWGRK